MSQFDQSGAESTAVVLYSAVHPEFKEEEESKEETKTQSESITKKSITYTGLCNQGATCYMNSLLQTLFMTEEFRRKLYKWKFDEQIHGQILYSIPYQLQKLFANLQLKHHCYVQTRALTKSFNWDISEVLQQQDIQEFCRVLFDALETTDEKDHENILNISSLYEGILVDYVKCSVCNQMSQREDKFLDISLPIEDPFTNTKNSSLEMALENYLKPEILDERNKYDCQTCKMKVCATKGLQFAKFPKILAIQLNRFTLNFETMTRIKINNKVTFPFILNMNNYANGYDGIKAKSKEIEEQLTKQLENILKTPSPKIKKDEERAKLEEDEKISNVQAIPAHTEDIPEAPDMSQLFGFGVSYIPERKTKSFGEEGDSGKEKAAQRPKEKPVTIGKRETREESIEPDDEKYNPYMFETKPKKRINYGAPDVIDDELNIYQLESEHLENDENIYAVKHTNEKFTLHGFGSGSGALGAPLKRSEQEEESKEDEGKGRMMNKEDRELAEALRQIKHLEQREKEAKETEERKKAEEQLKEDIVNQVKEYLTEGPEVFELFSVMIHSGSAFGGHYYVYIKSFEDNKWYNFNDTDVTEINQSHVLRTFGGPISYKSGAVVSGNSNAYMLMYRKIESIEEFEKGDLKIGDEVMPEYLVEAIKKEQEETHQEIKRREVNLKMMNLRVYLPPYEYKYMILNKTDTLKTAVQKAIRDFKLTETPEENVRIRRFAPTIGTMLDTYTGKDDSTLEELHIASYMDLCVEVKKTEEEFKDFSHDDFYVKYILFNEDIQTMESQHLNLEYLPINKNMTMVDLREALSKKINIEAKKIKVLRKTIVCMGDYRLETLSIEFNMDKKVRELKIFDGICMYLEEMESDMDVESTKWIKILEEDKDKIFIRFNNPYEGDGDSINAFKHQLILEKTQKLETLKSLISKEIKVAPGEFLIKRGGKYYPELKDLSQTLGGVGLMKQSSIFVEFGVPSKSGEFKISVCLAQLKDPLIEEENIIIPLIADSVPECKKETVSPKDSKESEEKKEKEKDELVSDDKKEEEKGSSEEKKKESVEDKKSEEEKNLDKDEKKLKEEMGGANDDIILHSFTELFVLPMSAYDLGGKFKQLISEKYLAKFNQFIHPNHIRIREKTADKLGRTVRDEMELRLFALYDQKSFGMQILQKEEELSFNDVFVIFREWDTQQWQLSKRIELKLQKNMTLHSLSYLLCQCFPHFRNQIDKLECCRISSLWSFKRGTLAQQNWQPIYNNLKKLEDSPFFVASDGSFMIIKDSSKEVWGMSKTDIEKYGSVESRQKTLGSHFASKVAGPKVPFVRRKEKGVKIQVKTLDMQKKEEEKRKKDIEDRKKEREKNEQKKEESEKTEDKEQEKENLDNAFDTVIYDQTEDSEAIELKPMFDNFP